MLIATLGSCQKGDTGPQGAQGIAGTNGTNGKDGTQGPAGDTGPQGLTGTTGATGPQGNANVNSYTSVVVAANWTWYPSTYTNQVNIPFSQITSDIVTNGMVAVFITGGTNIWSALPYTYYPSTAHSYTVSYSFTTGHVYIDMMWSDYTNSVFTSTTFKYVIIAGALRKAHPNTDWKNYDEVMAVMNESIVK